MSIRFDDRVAIVTGAGGGIGKEHALELARRGAKVVVNDLGGSVDGSGASDAANEVVDIIKSEGGEAIANGASVTDLDAVKEMTNQTMEKWGRIDILINNAGTNIRKRPEEYELKEWTSIIDTNLISTFTCSKAAFKHFKSINSGKIINIGSMHSLFGAPLGSAYSASKGGVVQLTKSLANTWAKDNIQVNAVLPGYIDTTLTRQARVDIPELQKRVEERTPCLLYTSPSPRDVEDSRMPSSA
mgnify:CR=1 FL=1